MDDLIFLPILLQIFETQCRFRIWIDSIQILKRDLGRGRKKRDTFRLVTLQVPGLSLENW